MKFENTENVLNIKDAGSDVFNRLNDFFEDMLRTGIEMGEWQKFDNRASTLIINPEMDGLNADQQLYLSSCLVVSRISFQVVFKKILKEELTREYLDTFLLKCFKLKLMEWTETEKLIEEVGKVNYGLEVKKILKEKNFDAFKLKVDDCLCIEKLNKEVIKSKDLDAYIYILGKNKGLFTEYYLKEIIINNANELFDYAIENVANPKMNDDQLLYYAILSKNYLMANKLVDLGCSVKSNYVLSAASYPEYEKVELYENLSKMKEGKKVKSGNKI